MPAVQVQMARLEQRLRSFARFQAAHRAQGWRISHCELAFDGTVALDVPGQNPMPIHGKIDRIDRHEQTGQWLIIDYKTGERGDSPHRAHHGCEKLPADGSVDWQDLQLPLYHYLARQVGIGIAQHDTVGLAYVCLPHQTNGARLKCAQWTANHLEEAIERARSVVQAIRAGRFDRNLDFDRRFDPFARICQSFAFAEPVPEEVES